MDFGLKELKRSLGLQKGREIMNQRMPRSNLLTRTIDDGAADIVKNICFKIRLIRTLLFLLLRRFFRRVQF